MKKLLVVIDYQKDFVDGALGFEKAAALETGIYEKTEGYLKEGQRVLFTYDTHYEEYLKTREGKYLPVMHCIKQTPGHELYGRLKELINKDNTYHLEKEGFGIAPKDIIALCEEIGADVEEIEIVGVVTNICVISNVVMFQSQFRNAEVKVDASLCASFDEGLHHKTLDVLEGLQVKVINRQSL